MVIIKLCAPNDTNGKPRRLFLLFESTDKLLSVEEEGYEGLAAVHRKFPEVKFSAPYTIAISAREYSRWKCIRGSCQ